VRVKRRPAKDHRSNSKDIPNNARPDKTFAGKLTNDHSLNQQLV
jgi:hypothetical protein